MPRSGTPLAATSSAVAVASRRRDPVALIEARRNHAAVKLEDYITRVVAEAPPLTTAQRERLAALLTGGAQ
ncbi:hypothetical protein GCM10022200_05510 [Microbacterium awajiense]|uniref:PhiRv1 phage protein n=1 Tax=Microbacterium awajiense TaxID=415214 RepID=A0ABP7A6Q7_9MICO